MIPTPQIPRDWFDRTNFSVGVSGLLLTVLAVVAAKGAKRAAIEARNGVRQRGASDGFNDLANTARQLSDAIRKDRSGEAAVRDADLMGQIPRERAKFERFLSADSVKISVLEARLGQLSARLSAPDALAEDESIQKATSDAHEASRVLNEICGRLMDRRDEGAK